MEVLEGCCLLSVSRQGSFLAASTSIFSLYLFVCPSLVPVEMYQTHHNDHIQSYIFEGHVSNHIIFLDTRSQNLNIFFLGKDTSILRQLQYDSLHYFLILHPPSRNRHGKLIVFIDFLKRNLIYSFKIILFYFISYWSTDNLLSVFMGTEGLMICNPFCCYWILRF